jgi:hypothetical protein
MRMHTCLHLLCSLDSVPGHRWPGQHRRQPLDFDIEDPSKVDKDTLHALSSTR